MRNYLPVIILWLLGAVLAFIFGISLKVILILTMLVFLLMSCERKGGGRT